MEAPADLLKGIKQVIDEPDTDDSQQISNKVSNEIDKTIASLRQAQARINERAKNTSNPTHDEQNNEMVNTEDLDGFKDYAVEQLGLDVD